MEGRSASHKGILQVAVEVFEMAPGLHMVEVRKAGGDTLEYHKVSPRSTGSTARLLLERAAGVLNQEDGVCWDPPGCSRPAYDPVSEGTADQSSSSFHWAHSVQLANMSMFWPSPDPAVLLLPVLQAAVSKVRRHHLEVGAECHGWKCLQGRSQREHQRGGCNGR